MAEPKKPTAHGGINSAPHSPSDASPLVAAVANDIAGRIHRGEYKGGRSLPSERSLGEEFGVSRIVIRAAMRELSVRSLIESKPRCRPVVKARALGGQRGTSKTAYRNLAIWVWPNVAEFGASTILQGIQKVSTSPDMRLVVASAVGAEWDAVLASEERFLKSVAEDPHTAGAIVYYLGHERNRHALEALRDAGIPVVLVDRLGPPGFESDFVGTDNRGSAARVVKALIASGHTRIACISNLDPVSTVHEREAGYRDALSEAGLPFRKEYVFRDEGDEVDRIESLIREILAMDERPTAIFAVNDHIALKAHDVFTRLGIAIPSEMSVAGFDGLLRWVPGGGPLTTARQNFERIGQVATELCLQRIESGGEGSYRHVLLEAPLMDQGSITVPPAWEQLVKTQPSLEKLP